MPEKTIAEFLFHCQYEKNLSHHTLKAYRLDLNQFTGYLASNNIPQNIEAIDKQQLRDYLQLLLKKNKIKTAKRKMATLKALFNYLAFEDNIAINPFHKIRLKLKEPLILPKALTLSEVKSLFQCAYKKKQQCKKHNSYSYKNTVRDIVVLELLFATGVRVSELCSLKIQNVSIAQKYILVTGKGYRERVIQICSPDIILIMKEYMDLFHPSTEDFPYFLINRLGKQLSAQSVRFMLKKYAKSAAIEKSITPHMFRHTFATLLLEEDVDIRYIQRLLGHSTITTTQIYTHIAMHKQKELLATRHPRINLDLH